MLIAAFNYYYTFLQLEPKEMAEQLKRQGASIPGVRPGRATAEYVTGTLQRMSILGSAFLAALSAAPQIVELLTKLQVSRRRLLRIRMQLGQENCAERVRPLRRPSGALRAPPSSSWWGWPRTQPGASGPSRPCSVMGMWTVSMMASDFRYSADKSPPCLWTRPAGLLPSQTQRRECHSASQTGQDS